MPHSRGHGSVVRCHRLVIHSVDCDRLRGEENEGVSCPGNHNGGDVTGIPMWELLQERIGVLLQELLSYCLISVISNCGGEISSPSYACPTWALI